MKRTIGVVTGSRADYGHYLPILRLIARDPDLELQLIVTGMHLSPQFGRTVDRIEADGFAIADRVEMLAASDAPAGIAASIGVGVVGLSQAFARRRPDILLLLGDRVEMLAAAAAALPFAIPIAHIHGGESTEGAIDEAVRHALTKMSHLHFAATDAYARRIRQMGEEPWRVVVSGAPGLAALMGADRFDAAAFREAYGFEVTRDTLLVTFHPVTLEPDRLERHLDELLAALERTPRPIVFSYPNADARSQTVIERIRRFVETHDRAHLVASFGTAAYATVMAIAAAMVGNSSSGIIEAASFGLPVVNIGCRQRGRHHGVNVIDVECERDRIVAAIREATSPAFRRAIQGMANPYGDGRAAERIAATLRTVAIDDRLLFKRFVDADVALQTA